MSAVIAVLQVVATLMRWSGTVGGTLPPDAERIESVEWVRADGSQAGWPRCVVRELRAWACVGIARDDRGVVLISAAGVWWSSVVEGRVARDLRRSRWGRLLVITRASWQAAPLRVTFHAPVPSSAARRQSIRLSTAPVPQARAVAVTADAIWIAGEAIPPASWIEIVSGVSAPLFLPLDDVAAAPAMLPLHVALGEARVVSGVVTNAAGRPAAGALLTLFRLIDPLPTGTAGPPPRRVFVGESIAGEEGRFALTGLGDADYEVVAWHSQFGRAAVLISSAVRDLDIALRAAGIARGRVLLDGRPMAGVDVISVPDPTTFSAAADMIDVKGGDARTGSDGRFEVMLAPSGGGELRIGGGAHAVRRIPLPPRAVPVVDTGDIDLGRGIPIVVVLDRDPGCELRAAGPAGRSGLHIVTANRHAGGAFDVTIPEPGVWEFTLTCQGREVALQPSMVQIAAAQAGKEVRMAVR